METATSTNSSVCTLYIKIYITLLCFEEWPTLHERYFLLVKKLSERKWSNFQQNFLILFFIFLYNYLYVSNTSPFLALQFPNVSFPSLHLCWFAKPYRCSGAWPHTLYSLLLLSFLPHLFSLQLLVWREKPLPILNSGHFWAKDDLTKWGWWVGRLPKWEGQVRGIAVISNINRI